ncbi:2-amino-4-hydroxy-6-hydroxymethyldihydropteridine diphosphokinase, partial [bacterium]|nr:2-amino-4-hydroxy-6-hydroxymethyldihydropteridine diphosphokinase [bacterium]
MDLEPGYFYHVFNRGNNGQTIFYSRENYLFFLKKMDEYLTPFASIISWCLMPNHFHWVIFVHRNKIKFKDDARTSRQGITKSINREENSNNKIKSDSHALPGSENMTKYRTINESIGILLRSYTRAIQKQEHFTGSLFQKHTKAKPLIDEIQIEPAYWNTSFGTQINISEGKNYLETCIEYIHQNPVYSKLVQVAEDWEYSSLKDFLGLRDGKLIDYDLLKKEELLPDFTNSGHALTSRQGMTKSNNWEVKSNKKIKNDNHTLTESESMTQKNMTAGANICIIGIGSNINAETNIPKMLEILKAKVNVLQVSSFLKTKPIGIINQPDFTNGAVKINTELNRADLNKMLKSIEDQ